MARPAVHAVFPVPSLTDAGRFALLVVQLGLLLLVLRQFQIESAAFLRVASLAFAGFVVHAMLPVRWRLPFFVLLSLTAVVMVLGFETSAWLLGLGAVLIVGCHLPLPFGLRLTVVAAIGVGLAVLRAGWWDAPWSAALWPILGSMFMFRLVIYLYDLRHRSAPFSPARALAYFFMLPNVCFPLFPVVDYKTFCRTYYDAEPYRIYQTGVDWITRGVVHLILYRAVYYYLTISPAEVQTAGDLLQFVVASFLLYLRISGQFHVIVGILHLYGFNLPETHHLYYLASSFTDFWRRINIYWKDFMMKIVYYPTFFALRRWGTARAMVAATLVVFVVTWALHAYQWFWLRGTVLLTGPDVAFWAVLAVLVVANSLHELRHGRRRRLGAGAVEPAPAVGLALRTVGTFATIAVLWSLWQSESLVEWFALWEALGRVRVADLTPLSVVIGGLVVGAVVVTAGSWRATLAGGLGRWASGWRSPMATVALLAGLAATGIQEVYLRLGPHAATVINSLRSGRLSRHDVAMLEKGYYENLNRVERFNSQLWELYMNRPASWLDVRGTGLERFTGDFLHKELVPSFVALTAHGPVSVNRWGMRDRDYEKVPPAGAYRIAVLGASSVMGWGVPDGRTFEALLERRLNEERAGRPFASYEILNFAVPGYQPLQQVLVLDRALSFAPHGLFYVATGREASRAAAYLAEVVSKGIEIPFDYLRDVLRRANVRPGTSESVAMRRLLPFGEEMLAWVYRTVVGRSRELGIVPVLIFLPQVEPGPWRGETPTILRLAREAGFIVWDLDDVYDGEPIDTVRLAPWDNHPNARGHELVAARLFQMLEAQADLVLRPRAGGRGVQ